MKRISILGSTGSIGRQTLEVVSRFPERFCVVGLAAGKNVRLLEEQIAKFRPKVVSVTNGESARELSHKGIEVLYGEKGASTIAALDEADLVVSAMVGAAGLKPTLSAVKAGKDVALANKESLVIAGEIITREARKSEASLLPVDSEHSAVFQVLARGRPPSSRILKEGLKDVQRLILTASGGPFLNTPKKELDRVSVALALNHPTWKMGRKISIDSATLMNKGFEVIEASWLFGFAPKNISVWIHPQSIVHSMVEYIDGSVISQMSEPDMKIPIAYALSYPDRISLSHKIDAEEDAHISFGACPNGFGELSFMGVDYERYPCLSIALDALQQGGDVPSVINGANEVAVEAFLSERIGFTDIARIVRKVMNSHRAGPASELEEVLESDEWARKKTLSLLDR